jgi:anti-anti-sigma factor
MNYRDGSGGLRVDADARGFPQVAVFGEIDIATVGVLRDALNIRSSRKTLTVDLSGVTFIGSCGLTLLLEAQREAAREGREIALTRTAPCVDRLLQISGCEPVLRRL